MKHSNVLMADNLFKIRKVLETTWNLIKVCSPFTFEVWKGMLGGFRITVGVERERERGFEMIRRDIALEVSMDTIALTRLSWKRVLSFRVSAGTHNSGKFPWFITRSRNPLLPFAMDWDFDLSCWRSSRQMQDRKRTRFPLSWTLWTSVD